MSVVAGHADWERVTVETGGDIYTERMRVPGGWLYRTLVLTNAVLTNVPAVALAFVPDQGKDFPAANAGLEGDA